MTLLFAENYANCWLDSETPCLVLEWLGYVPSADYRRIMERLLTEFDRLRTEGCHLTAVLTDAARFESQLTVDQEWSVLDFGNRLLAAGLLSWALVRPRHLLGRQALANRLARIAAHQQQVRVGAFDDRERARHWLRGQAAACEPAEH